MSWKSIFDVVTPADSYDLISLENFKADHGITSNAEDAQLRRMISKASAAIQRACNRVFALETVSETIWIERPVSGSPVVYGLGELPLSRYPIFEIEHLIEAGEELEETVDFAASKQAGLILRLDCNGIPVCWTNKDKITVQYSAGYDEIPLDLQDAVSMTVWDKVQNNNQNKNIKSTYVDGIDRVEYFAPSLSAFPSGVQEILDGFRAPVLR